MPEEAFDFVRSNPFVQNDRAAHSPSAFSHRPNPAHATTHSFLGLSVVTHKQNDDHTSVHMESETTCSDSLHPLPSPSHSDIEYGPGHVQKLRAKFSQMAGEIARHVAISPHSRRKRFPSVDDLLSTPVDEERARREKHSAVEMRSRSIEPSRIAMGGNSRDDDDQTMTRLSYSRSTSDFDHTSQQQPARMNATKKDGMRWSEDGAISVLRHKFEEGSGRSPAHRKRITGSTHLAHVISARRSASVHDRSPVAGLDRATLLTSPTSSIVPEFVLVSQRMRHHGNRDEMEDDRRVGQDELKAEHLRYFKAHDIVRNSRSMQTPIFSSKTHILPLDRDEGTAPYPIRVADLLSPPDPDSARSPSIEHASSHVVEWNFASPVADKGNRQESGGDSAGYNATFGFNDRSPTPDEPRPPHQTNMMEERSSLILPLQRAQSKPSAIVRPVIASPNDGSGINEMQRLLNKFNTKREHKANLDVSTNANDSGMQTTIPRTSPPRSSPNIVSISVTTSSHSKTSRIHRDDAPVHDPGNAPPPPSSMPPSAVASRRSISAQFLETKRQQEMFQHPPKPYGDDAVVQNGHLDGLGNAMMDGVKSGVFHFHHHPSSSNAIAHLDSPMPASSDEQTDDEQRLQGSGVVKLMPSVSVEEVQRRIGEEHADLEALRHSLLKKKHGENADSASDASSDSDGDCEDANSSSKKTQVRTVQSLEDPQMIAGDGNPVRHSLINLVLEEDIPLLLEAMAEKFNFYFEDLFANSSSMPIIFAPAMRNERKQRRNVNGGIKFVENPPQVFTYPDEASAVKNTEWLDGLRISYAEYQALCNELNNDVATAQAEIQRWHNSLVNGHVNSNGDKGTTAVSRPLPSDLPFVTSRFSYGSVNAFNGVESPIGESEA